METNAEGGVMTHEKVIQREDGSQVKIGVRFRADWIKGVFFYHTVFVLQGRIWTAVVPDCKVSISPEEMKSAYITEELKYVTPEEIFQAKLELWEKLKPVEIM